MCLFKRDQKDTNCGHEECKKYYALNKQLCVYNLNNSSASLPMLQNQNILLQNSNQQRQFTQASLSQDPSNFQQSLNGKRPQNLNETTNEHEIGLLNKKMIKTKGKSFFYVYLFAKVTFRRKFSS